MRVVVFNENIADENSYLVVHKDQAVLIDPGFNGEKIQEFLSVENIILAKVLLTHGHFDHLRDIVYLAKHHSFSIHIHRADYPHLLDSSLNYSLAFNASFQLPKACPVIQFQDGESIAFANEVMQVFHTPGHTAGSSCFYLHQWLFTGDTLFSDSVGRTDLVSGSGKALRQSLLKIKDQFSNETMIYPGHGRKLKLAEVKKTNPFL